MNKTTTARLESLKAAIVQFKDNHGAVTFTAHQNEDGSIRLDADYQNQPGYANIALAMCKEHEILTYARLKAKNSEVKFYIDIFGTNMVSERTDLS